MTYSRKLLVLALAAYLCLSHAPVSMAGKPTKPDGGGGGTSAPSYTFVRLDYAGGTYQPGYGIVADLNEFGGVVGDVQLSTTGADQAAYWNVTASSSTLTVLDAGSLEAGDPYYATGVNDLGEIVGAGISANPTPLLQGLYWPSPLADPLVLPPLSEGKSCRALDINNRGLIIGSARSSTNSALVAVAWRVIQVDGDSVILGPVELPNSLFPFSEADSLSECDANDVAEAVGYLGATQYDNHAAVKWHIACLPDGSIEVAGDAEVLDIASASGDTKALGGNALGIACGYYSSDVYAAPRRATVWTGAGPRTLADPPKIGKSSAPFVNHTANDLNDAGMIVGTAYNSAWESGGQAVLWTSVDTVTPIRLESLLPKRNRPLTSLLGATAINNAGRIIGFGTSDGGLAGFVAIPQ